MKLGLREIVFIALLMCIPLGAWAFVFRPRNALNEELKRQIQHKQEKLKELNQATGTIGNLKAEIAALEEAIEFFQSKLPSEKEIDKVLEEVWQTAEENRLTTKSIRTLDSDQNSAFTSMGGPREQPIAMQLDGDFMGFFAFLQALENQPRIMRISQMELQKPPRGPEGHMQAKFKMSIFFESSS